jgi:hypothetical protein
MKLQKNKFKPYKTPLVAIILAILILTGLLVWHAHSSRTSKVAKTASPYTKGQPAATPSVASPASPTDQNSPNASQQSDQKSGTGAANNLPLITPSGNFVSNHTPGQNGSPNSEVSVCNTTPGALCKIVFTKDGVIKSLPEKAADSGGTVYWNNWLPKDYGLTAGSWQIQAVASLNGQTKTASDSMDLVVQ